MRIQIRLRASQTLCYRLLRHRPSKKLTPSEQLLSCLLGQVEGQWVEVNTAYLFADQFNTQPIRKVSKKGLRVHYLEVQAIEGDVRPTATKCPCCGRTVLDDLANVGKPCPNCHAPKERMKFKPLGSRQDTRANSSKCVVNVPTTQHKENRTVPRKPTAKQQAKILDDEINKFYLQHAKGKSINIMDIGKVFDAGRTAAKAGQSVEEAVKAAVEKFCSK